MRQRSMRLVTGLLGTVGIIPGCSDSTEPAHEDHTPVRLEATVNGVIVTDDTLRLATGATDSVRITFYNQADENLDVAEAEHYSVLTFTSSAGITATASTDRHFRHGVAVTAPAGTAGDVNVGYGHDIAADEHNFPLAYLIVP